MNLIEDARTQVETARTELQEVNKELEDLRKSKAPTDHLAQKISEIEKHSHAAFRALTDALIDLTPHSKP